MKKSLNRAVKSPTSAASDIRDRLLMARMMADLMAAHEKLKNSQAEVAELAKGVMDKAEILSESVLRRPAPEKGKDYFTPKEIQSVINTILASLPSPKDGVDGEPGTPGITPKKGEDYFTQTDIEGITRQVLGRIPLVKDGLDGKHADPEVVIEQIRKGKKLKVDDLDGWEQTRRALESQIKKGTGYVHGGGDTVSAGTNITLVRLPDGTVQINSSGGSGSYSILAATGTIDDSNTSFSFLALPTEIVINGASYIQTGGAITWTWNIGTLTATLSSPVGTGGSIYGRV